VTIDDLQSAANKSFVKSSDIVELTGGGIQIASSATRFVRMPQTTSTQVLFTGGGIEIDQGGTSTESGLTLKNSTAEWRIFNGNSDRLFFYQKFDK
jgi:hypothetical protein